MKLKLLLLFAFFYETVDAHSEMIFSIPNKCVAKNLQKSFDGAGSVAKTYPGTTYQVGETLMTSWKILIDKVGTLSKSNSTILSTSSAELLESMSMLNKFGVSATNILREWAIVMPTYSKARANIVSNLSEKIGELTQCVNQAIEKEASETIKIVEQFQSLDGQSDGLKKIEPKALIKATQIVINIIALIAETSLDICELKPDVYEGVAAVILLCHSIAIGCTGTYTNIAAVLYSTSLQEIAEILNNCLLALTPLVEGMAKSINAMTDTAESISVLLKDFVRLTKKFNDQLFRFGLGFCNEDRNKSIKLTVAEVKRQLLRGD
ncbi:uncharacterized protein LOC119066666 [Bradysia coprophila]|uniref:uncharacterized protein LOC119066666 n=1 Tax=Bradysia coprophila TaxID=38358 RepID=UPI00187D8D15|nr:uncharacterized protein LOC119066666 [Bradysia coprophila]